MEGYRQLIVCELLELISRVCQEFNAKVDHELCDSDRSAYETYRPSKCNQRELSLCLRSF